MLGAQNLALRGGAGAEAATNHGSARTPLPAANHRSVSPSRPPRPLFPLARWPAAGLRPYDFRPRGSGRVHACAGPARGRPGIAVRRPARGLAHSGSICPEWLWRVGTKRSGGGLWLGVVGTARRSTGPGRPGQSSSSGSTFPSSSSQRRCLCCGVSPDKQLSYPLACDLLADCGVFPVTVLEVAGASIPFCSRVWGIPNSEPFRYPDIGVPTHGRAHPKWQLLGFPNLITNSLTNTVLTGLS